jgi:hypothetical protein
MRKRKKENRSLNSSLSVCDAELAWKHPEQRSILSDTVGTDDAAVFGSQPRGLAELHPRTYTTPRIVAKGVLWHVQQTQVPTEAL